MCGFIGIFSPAGKTQDSSLAQKRLSDTANGLELLRHRGPDAQNIAILKRDGQIASRPISQWQELAVPETKEVAGHFGHARLKIIDLSDNANQPFEYTAPNGKRYVIAYNGEIYNFAELKRELQNKNYRFSTSCDTEILPALYDLYGPGMTTMLNGMFAFALYDMHEQTVFLACDRYGVKPLYTTFLPDGSLAFASEMKSLLVYSDISPQLNPQALYEHFTFQYVLGDHTLLNGIDRFPPGHWGLFDLERGQYQTHQYWQPAFSPDAKIREADAIDRLRFLLENAVSRQLLADMPIGGFLSGGIDTGAISAIASRHIPNLFTLTCGFDLSGIEGGERYFDERKAARRLAVQLQTNHHELTITADTLPHMLPSVIWYLDDFQAGISYQNFAISKLVRQHVTVVLSGVGGDELFAGYPWRYQGAMADIAPKDFTAQFYRQCTRLLNDEQKQAVFHPKLLANVHKQSTLSLFQQAFEQTPAESPLQKALGFDMRFFLKALLRVEDSLSMGHSVESRVPFLDNELVDFCLELPDALKLRYVSEQGGWIGKWGLRQSLNGILPSDIIRARKQGFTPPDASWYRQALRPWIEGILLSEQALSRSIFQPATLKELLNEHLEQRQNHRFLIWSLLCLELWQRQFLDVGKPETLSLRGKI